MTTLKEAGFRGVKVATGEGMSLAMGTLADGRLVLVARTPQGEGYTEYATYPKALLAFDAIMLNAGLAEVLK